MVSAANRAEVLGVRVIQPSDKRVDEAVQQVFGRSSASAGQVPRSTTVLLENQSGKRVVFYSLKWSARDSRGKIISTVSFFASSGKSVGLWRASASLLREEPPELAACGLERSLLLL